ncbi:hypothetical protein SLE2022_386370 [Rubroshorea leprosula]
MEDDDTEMADDVESEAERRDQHQHNCWEDEQQNGKKELISVVNDKLINEEDSQGKNEAIGDRKIQISSTENQERMIAVLEMVPNGLDVQLNKKKEGQWRNESDGSSGPLKQIARNGPWVKKGKRPNLKINVELVNIGPHSMEVDKEAEDDDVAKRVLIEKVRENKRGNNCSTDTHSVNEEISFWEGFESESGQEQEWMG